jgi:hypothetical protein
MLSTLWQHPIYICRSLLQNYNLVPLKLQHCIKMQPMFLFASYYKRNKLTAKILSECGRIKIAEDHTNYSHKQIRCITFWVFLLPFISHLPPKTLIDTQNWLHLRTCCLGCMYLRAKPVQETAYVYILATEQYGFRNNLHISNWTVWLQK